MFIFIKKVLILVLISTANSLKCISLKNQECKVIKAIVDNKYMAYPYKIEIDRCVVVIHIQKCVFLILLKIFM